MGKILITVGVVLLLAGVIIQMFGKVPFLGKLPGDIVVDRPNFKFYFPIMSSIVISIVISLIVYLINRYKN